jgi:rfaE bifunctional protein nucleotidyltransferase chain/domain
MWANVCKKKWIDPKDLQSKIESLRVTGKTIATLNGSFDLLHAGHLFIIFEASKQADILIVALNSDASIKKYKGEKRPIIPLKERLELMSSIEFVDYVTWFDEIDPRAILSIIQPDVHVNGAEYGPNCIEADTVRKAGGNLVLIERVPQLATSEIITKIKEL